jgi:hypothetical protein
LFQEDSCKRIKSQEEEQLNMILSSVRVGPPSRPPFFLKSSASSSFFLSSPQLFCFLFS